MVENYFEKQTNEMCLLQTLNNYSTTVHFYKKRNRTSTANRHKILKFVNRPDNRKRMNAIGKTKREMESLTKELWIIIIFIFSKFMKT